MKEFKSAVEDVIAEEEREERIAVLVATGKTQAEAEAEVDSDRGEYVEFKIDDRVMKSYKPDDTQMAFMLASLGRGQTKTGRFSAILNIMFESLDEDDKDWLEERMLTGNKKNKISIKTIEGIFEYLMEEWFRETVPGDGEAGSAAV